MRSQAEESRDLDKKVSRRLQEKWDVEQNGSGSAPISQGTSLGLQKGGWTKFLSVLGPPAVSPLGYLATPSVSVIMSAVFPLNYKLMGLAGPGRRQRGPR